MTISLEAAVIDKPADVNVIVGQSHFIKTVEDLHEVLAGASPYLRFGIAFCEASQARLVRRSGNDPELTSLAVSAATAIPSESFITSWITNFRRFKTPWTTWPRP